MRKTPIILLSLFLGLSFLSSKILIHQARVKSTNYEIQFPNFNSGAGLPESANYSVNTTIGRISGNFASNSYIIKAGFQYVSSIIPFSFSLSSYLVDFDTPTLTPGTPATETATITIKAGGAGGYSLKVYEEHPLQDANLNTIPDTLCDTTCSEALAASWTSSSKYGFGLNMQGDDVPADFTGPNDYRQFADISNSESAGTIMSKAKVTYDYPNNAWPWESIATVTYKVNVSDIQPAGRYQTIVKYVAMPTF